MWTRRKDGAMNYELIDEWVPEGSTLNIWWPSSMKRKTTREAISSKSTPPFSVVDPISLKDYVEASLRKVCAVRERAGRDDLS